MEHRNAESPVANLYRLTQGRKTRLYRMTVDDGGGGFGDKD